MTSRYQSTTGMRCHARSVRTQAAVGDTEFLRSMIPHHSGAILMCREADLRDAELLTLCEEIIAAQRSEIEQMETIKARLDQRP